VQPFTYEGHAVRVVFGAGGFARLAEEAARIGRRLLVLATPEQADLAEQAGHRLGALCAGVHPHAVMHVPAAAVDKAMAVAESVGADGFVAVGGGSTTGLAKALTLRTSLPILAVPTTYAGSEMTPIWGLTEGGIKRTGRDIRVLPCIAVYDPDLTLSLPAALSGVSGLNSVAHCVEGLYAKEANPLVSIMAEEGIRAFARSLPVIARDPANREARSDALYGAWLGGTVLGMVGMALHHKLCHTLGGSFDLPHAQTHAILLPHATAYNAGAAPDAIGRVARALGTDDAARGLAELLRRVSPVTALSEIGMPETGIARAVELAMANPYYNPAPLEADRIEALLRRAYAGDWPANEAG